MEPYLFSKLKKQVALNYLLFNAYGAEGGGRTRTVLLPQDFESCTSANSITSAYQYILTYFWIKIKKNFIYDIINVNEIAHKKELSLLRARIILKTIYLF